LGFILDFDKIWYTTKKHERDGSEPIISIPYKKTTCTVNRFLYKNPPPLALILRDCALA